MLLGRILGIQHTGGRKRLDVRQVADEPPRQPHAQAHDQNGHARQEHDVAPITRRRLIVLGVHGRSLIDQRPGGVISIASGKQHHRIGRSRRPVTIC